MHDQDPIYECPACWWTGDEPPVGPNNWLICPDCGADVDDYDPTETTRERLLANVATCEKWSRVVDVVGGRKT